MEIHKPKPFHGWRELLKEFGIIVLGVLTALAAEQAVEWLHWRNLVDEGRRDLAASYAKVNWLAAERDIQSRCVGVRLNEIASLLDQASKTGRLPPVGDLSEPRERLWTETEWPTLVSAQTAVRFPRAEARQYSVIADYTREVDIEANKELDDWATLYTIVGPGRAVGESELSKLRSAFSSALYHARDMRLAASQLTDLTGATRLRTDAATTKRYADRIAQVKRSVEICQPMGPAPAAYSHAPLEQFKLEAPLPQRVRLSAP
jgi:hypothetical protein